MIVREAPPAENPFGKDVPAERAKPRSTRKAPPTGGAAVKWKRAVSLTGQGAGRARGRAGAGGGAGREVQFAEGADGGEEGDTPAGLGAGARLPSRTRQGQQRPEWNA